MKKTLFAIIFLLIIQCGFSQTNVSGPYFTNTTWNLSGNPYNVIGDVQIPTGVTLTINPGVQINFSGNYEILIKGTIICNGTNTLPINYTGNSSGTAMLMFKSTNLTNSQLSHVNFTGPKNAFQLANESQYSQDSPKNSGVLSINNVEFINTTVKTKGYETTASLVIDSATISTTSIIGVYPVSETIEIKNSNLSNCTINSDSYNYGITLRNSIVNNSDFTIGCCGANFNIIKSSIENSNFSDYNDNYEITIDESQIINTPFNLTESNYGINISKSSISYTGAYAIKCYRLTMSCTTIEGNGSGTGIELYGSNNIILNSTLKDNNIAIKNNSSSALNIDSTNFINNSLYHIQNISSQNISANKNWWGTTDSTTIANKIYDYYDNINFGIVNTSNKLNTIFTSQNCPDTLNLPSAIPKNENKITAFVFGLMIYPNPSSAYFNLEFENSKNENEDVIIEIFNVMGQVFYKERLSKSTQTKTIDVSNYAKGIYFCKLCSGKDFEVKKLLVQ